VIEEKIKIGEKKYRRNAVGRQLVVSFGFVCLNALAVKSGHF